MSTGYCVKCRKKTEISNATNSTSKNGRKMVKGNCPTCSTKICSFSK